MCVHVCVYAVTLATYIIIVEMWKTLGPYFVHNGNKPWWWHDIGTLPALLALYDSTYKGPIAIEQPLIFETDHWSDQDSHEKYHIYICLLHTKISYLYASARCKQSNGENISWLEWARCWLGRSTQKWVAELSVELWGPEFTPGIQYWSNSLIIEI